MDEEDISGEKNPFSCNLLTCWQISTQSMLIYFKFQYLSSAYLINKTECFAAFGIAPKNIGKSSEYNEEKSQSKDSILSVMTVNRYIIFYDIVFVLLKMSMVYDHKTVTVRFAVFTFFVEVVSHFLVKFHIYSNPHNVVSC